LAQIGLLGWGAALALLLARKDRLAKNNQSLMWAVVIGVPIELWMVSLGGRPRIPYFLTLLPVLSILAGFTFWIIFDSLLKDISNLFGAVLVILMVITLGSVFWADYSEMAQDFLKPSGDSNLVAYIQNNSDPDDFVLMWGTEAAYNFTSRRISPTRYVYQTPLYNIKKREPVLEFLRGIIKNKPRLIVLNAGEKLSDYRFGYRDNQIGALMDQIKGSYGNPIIFGEWLVYSFAGQ